MVDQSAFANLATSASTLADQADKRLETPFKATSIDWTQLVLSVSIIFVYIGSVAGVLIYFGVRSQSGPATMDPYGSAMLDILKVVVLPVVTFMLGFYFGTGSTSLKSSNPS